MELHNNFERRVMLANRSGKLSFASEKNFDISLLSKNGLGKNLKLLNTLDLSRTSITTLEGMKRLPKLSTFTAVGSNLSDFKNFAAIRGCPKVNLRNTPLSRRPNFKLSLYLVMKESIIQIDGERIPDTVKVRAKSYPKFVGDLINKGWEIRYPCPSDDELQKLCDEYKVNYEYFPNDCDYESSSSQTQESPSEASQSSPKTPLSPGTPDASPTPRSTTFTPTQLMSPALSRFSLIPKSPSRVRIIQGHTRGLTFTGKSHNTNQKSNIDYRNSIDHGTVRADPSRTKHAVEDDSLQRSIAKMFVESGIKCAHTDEIRLLTLIERLCRMQLKL